MKLKTKHRVTKRPHVTIVHRSAIDRERDVWDRCTGLHEMTTATPPLFKGTLRNVVWDTRVMAITVDDLDLVEASEGSSEESKNNEQAREFVSNLPDATRSRLHITVATLRDSIKPVEAKSMVEQWRKGEEPDIIKSIKLDNQVVYGRIKGLVT
jgi:tRNA ligase